MTMSGTGDAPESSPAELPLSGLKVIELHAIGPVPFAGMLLRQMGAEVTRVSPRLDPGIGLMTPPAFDLLNLGKAALALDLKQTADREVMRDRLAAADVLLEGFRPGVLERLHMAPADLLARHPRLVIGRLSGWGDAGPLAARAGHDINYLALTGVLATVGKADQPVPPMNLVADFGGGAMHLLNGVLARLTRRGIDGKGGLVTASIAGSTVGLTAMVYGLLAVTGLEQRLDPTLQYQRTHWPVAEATFARRFAELDRDAWAVAAADRDCCLTPVLNLAEAATHPHLLANGWFDEPGEGFAAPRTVLRFYSTAGSRKDDC